uniref:MalT-like TPR region domain-containing protein n=1 Tax=Fusarium oxysporum (strain Fo5176) TaxID=660025 RepID=A0A0D2Y319_FUSOF
MDSRPVLLASANLLHTAITNVLLNVADKILRGFSFPYRLTEVSFSQSEAYQDGRASFDETVTRLQGFIESPRSRNSRKTEPPYLMILADTPGSELVKGVSIHCSSGIPANTNLILLFQDSEQSNAGHPINKHTRQQVSTRIKTINDLFDEMILKHINPELNSMVWATSRQRGFVDDESPDNDLLSLLRGPFEVVLRRLYDALRIPFTLQFLPVGSTDSTTYFTQAKRYEDVLKASMPPKTSVFQTKPGNKSGLQKAEFTSNIPRESSGKARWEDLRDQAESRLESGDNKHALAMFQECLRMDIPYNTAVWEIKSGLAFARMMLGQYVQAENDLHQLRDDLRFLYSPRVREELNAADKWCEKLDNLKTETPNEVNTVDEWCEVLAYIQPSEGIRISNILNKSRINVLRGYYRHALSVLEPALSDAIVKIGETNLLTIEVALLSSFLQVETGQVGRGRISCERCVEVIEEAFGNEHPLALEAEYILISAAQQEGMFILALDDSASLCRRAEASVDLGHNHPSALKYKTQLGTLHIECGNYLTAKTVLTEVKENGLSLWGADHPEALRVRSQLALAQYHLGELESAESDIFSALYCQLQTYLRYQSDKLWPKHDSNCGIRSFLREAPLLQGIADAFAASDSGAAPHPDILYTLFTCGKILTRQPLSDLDLALRILGLEGHFVFHYCHRS